MTSLCASLGELQTRGRYKVNTTGRFEEQKKIRGIGKKRWDLIQIFFSEYNSVLNDILKERKHSNVDVEECL